VATTKAGLDVETLFKIVSVGAPNSGIFQMLVSSVLAGTYDGLQFGLDLARKDVRYYTHLTESLGVPSMLGAAVHQAFIQASALGYGSELVPSLIKAQAQVAGTSLPRRAP
jgi:3-hydroxyisobutyrate dehydrogenase-like beta-hydroxyacid dehydrogenase